jgi:hypothetical protein
MRVLMPLLCFHTSGYWAIQRFAARSQCSLRELTASTYLDAIAFLHTILTFYTVSSNPVSLFHAVSQPSFWVHSQYAMEIVINGFGMLKSYWNPLHRPPPEFIAHHALALVLLVGSYVTRQFNAGIVVLTLTNSTNLFFDYFKFGILLNDPTVRWASSVVFWFMFGLYRIFLFAQIFLIPFTQGLSWRNPYLAFAPFVYGLYGFQLWWFYRITHHTLKNTRHWLRVRSSAIDSEVETDFRELLESIKPTERALQSHILDNENTSTSTSVCAIEENTPISEASTVNLSEWNTIQEHCTKLLNNHTITEISEMADHIIDEALGQWRSVMLKQLELVNKKDN